MDVADTIANRLKELGFRVAVRRLTSCSVISAQIGEKVYVVSLSRGAMVDTYVAKVVVPELLMTSDWSCEVLEYSPHGYYVLEKDVDRLFSGMIKRFEVVDRIYRGPG